MNVGYVFVSAVELQNVSLFQKLTSSMILQLSAYCDSDSGGDDDDDNDDDSCNNEFCMQLDCSNITAKSCIKVLKTN